MNILNGLKLVSSEQLNAGGGAPPPALQSPPTLPPTLPLSASSAIAVVPETSAEEINSEQVCCHHPLVRFCQRF